MCNGVADQTEPARPAPTGAALRLRLVNGWIWVNDLDTGALWVDEHRRRTRAHRRLGQRPRLRGRRARREPGQRRSDGEDRGEPRRRRRSFQDAEQIDEDGINEPPVARDDAARDPRRPAGGRRRARQRRGPRRRRAAGRHHRRACPPRWPVAVTPRPHSVQVSPPPGFTGNIAFSYTITDGRGGVGVRQRRRRRWCSNDGANNRPPIAVTDVAEVRAGASAAFNVLTNDSDPDGDTFVLSDVQVPSGRVVFDPSGEVTFTPEPGQPAGTVELQYAVVDTFGATANGTVRVQIRLDGSNNEPDAPQRLGGHRGRQAGHAQRAGQRHRPRQRPADRRRPADARRRRGVEPDALDEITLQRRRRVLLPRRPSPATTCSSTRSSTAARRDAAVHPRPRRPGRPRTDRRSRPRRHHDQPRRHPQRVRAAERRRPRRRRDRASSTGPPARASRSSRSSASRFRVTVLPDAPARTQFTLHDLRRHAPIPSTGTVVVSVSDTDTARPATRRPARHVEVRPGRTALGPRAGQRLRPRGRRDPRGRRGRRRRRPTLRIGPGGQDDLRVGRPGDRSPAFSFGYDVADEAGNRTGSFVQVRLVPSDEANRPPVARADVARTGRADDHHRACWPTTPIPTATRSRSTRSPPSRRSAPPRPTPTARSPTPPAGGSAAPTRSATWSSTPTATAPSARCSSACCRPTASNRPPPRPTTPTR